MFEKRVCRKATRKAKARSISTVLERRLPKPKSVFPHPYVNSAETL